MIGVLLFFVMAEAMGVAFFWDVRGFASLMRRRMEAGPFGGLYRRLPSWTYRAFGVWCFAFGFGQFAYFYAITHH